MPRQLAGELANGHGATLLWPVRAITQQPGSDQSVLFQASVAPHALLPWPAWSYEEPLRLDLHDLSQSRRPRRSAGWQRIASRPQAIVSESTPAEWRLRCGWLTARGWQWVVLSYPRLSGDHLAIRPEGLRIRGTTPGSRLAQLAVPTAVLDLPRAIPEVLGLLPLPAGSSLPGLVASTRAAEAQLVGLVRQAEQDYLASGQARQAAESEL